MAKITYENKVALNQNPNINAINKVQDTDMNQIKEVVNENETKILLAVTDTEPAECSTGDMYYNTTDDLIYTATATDTWSSTGVAPTENTLYVVLTTQTSYMYDGNTLVSIGGGTGSSDIVIVDPDTPTADTKLYIESTDLDFQGLDYVEDVYSTNEVKTNKVWIDGKPIYRKCFSLTNISSSLSNIDLTSLNIEYMISISGFSYNSSLQIPVNFYNTGNFNQCYYSSNIKSLQYQFNFGSDAYIIIEYTKAN